MYSIVLCLNPARDTVIRADKIILGEPNSVKSVVSTAGGKGINVAKVLRKCNKKCILTGFLGGMTGDWILRETEKQGIESDFVRTKNETRTNIKLLTDDGSYTELNSKGALVYPEEEKALYEKVFSILRKICGEKEENEPVFIIASGSIPQGVENSVYKNIIESVKAKNFKNVKFFVDCDNILLKNAVEARPFLIKPNIYEFSRLVDKKFSTTEEAVKSCELFFKETGINVLMSCGDKGAYLVSKYGTFKRECINIPGCMPNGAGDTMLGAFVAAYDDGFKKSFYEKNTDEKTVMSVSLEFAMNYVREFLINGKENIN